MLQKVLSLSPCVTSHAESHKSVFERTLLRSFGNVRYRIIVSQTRVVEFKPLNDAQNVDVMLRMHPNARAIWIYRHYSDVVNSMVRLWGATARAQVAEIASGEYSNDWRRALGERISDENRQLLKKALVHHVDEYNAAALIWYLRNALCFDRGLHTNENALICRYEDLVSDSRNLFETIFAFADIPFDVQYIQGVHSTSVHRDSQPDLRPDIAEICEKMVARLDSHRVKSDSRTKHN